MKHSIQTVYVVHHSHTDIGYTDLQERVIDTQVDYLRTVLSLMEQPEYGGFRWNCETLFCVEEFWKSATEEEKAAFLRLVAGGKIGLSANYLNFNDLVDCSVYRERLSRWQQNLSQAGAAMRTAMMADINGISMGYRDAMLAEGVEFLFANVHCHHGMYPLYQNQNAFWWENAAGQRLLVWNGEHYNLGNVLGVKPNRTVNFMTQNHLGRQTEAEDSVAAFHRNLDQYLSLCEEYGYAYDFIVTAVSGVFSDNAPPEPEILRTIEAYNQRYGQEVQVQMVSLQELYAAIRPKLEDAPVYQGDWNDWWANGVGSTPYAVKHYKDARHRYQLCKRLDGAVEQKYPELYATAQDHLMLYAEHTWGHSSTITNPYDTMVLNLDMRKNSYASKAHEAASRMLNRIAAEKGDILRYYSTCGKIQVCHVSDQGGQYLVEFYIESPTLARAEILDMDGTPRICQVSPHPRGRKISFVDTFAPHEEKYYTYRELPEENQTLNSRKCYVGAERVRDIVNDYDPVTYRLPYEFENAWFHLQYCPHVGVTALVDKRTGQNLLGLGEAPFFTPLYEVTPITIENPEFPCREEQERRILGRNIRGKHARLYVGELEEVSCVERGSVFTQLRMRFRLPGTVRADVFVKLYEAMPRIDFHLQLGKTLSSDIESVFLPLSLQLPDSSLYLRKGSEAFRPGIDQIPGTCMEYYMSDDGLAYLSPQGSALIATRDTPLLYMGEMKHHPIQLCDGKEIHNHRPVYSWIMNNTWETNFKLDLSGFGEYGYSLWLSDETEPEQAMDELRERCFDPHVLVVEQF
ncbi:MAG: hypothetical protein KHX25_04310 [Firmicutes bacterium]|nr:hypothetical protein [Bacillota bacterium]